jgi:thymidylate synthase (FAD)
MTLTLTRSGWLHEETVLDHGIVQLIDSMGDDLRIVNAAQASFDTESADYGHRESRILNSLIREEHGVPFEHIVFTFKIRLPLFLARQYVKHRHGSWSEHSGRYSPLYPIFYVPEPENVRTQVGKAMDYQFTEADSELAGQFLLDLDASSREAFQDYQRYVDGGVAKEQARFFLQENRYTTVVWTLNLRSLFNVIRLRVDSHAQWEAQEYARALDTLARVVVPGAMELWEHHGRPKP